MHAAYACTRSGSPHNVMHSASIVYLMTAARVVEGQVSFGWADRVGLIVVNQNFLCIERK